MVAAKPNKNYVTAINIILPWWLRWAKKYVSLDINHHRFGELKGLKAEHIIIDEINYGEKE